MKNKVTVSDHILHHLRDAGGAETIPDLMTRFSALSRTTIWNALKRLQQANLVERYKLDRASGAYAYRAVADPEAVTVVTEIPNPMTVAVVRAPSYNTPANGNGASNGAGPSSCLDRIVELTKEVAKLEAERDSLCDKLRTTFSASE